MSFNGIFDVLKRAQELYPSLRKRIQESEALSRWDQSVGPQIARHTRPIRVVDSVLWVEVDHPVWKAELHHRRRQILELLNQGREGQAPAKEVLKDLFFVDPRPAAPEQKSALNPNAKAGTRRPRPGQ